MWINFPRYNESPANCSDDPYRASCFIAQDEVSEASRYVPVLELDAEMY